MNEKITFPYKNKKNTNDNTKKGKKRKIKNDKKSYKPAHHETELFRGGSDPYFRAGGWGHVLKSQSVLTLRDE